MILLVYVAWINSDLIGFTYRMKKIEAEVDTEQNDFLLVYYISAGQTSLLQVQWDLLGSIDLLGVTIDKHLSFNRHTSQICEKVNKQFSVLKRFKNIITSNVMLRLCKTFILPHFQYCSLIWHFSGTRNCDKLVSLNKRILRFIFNDSLSSYDELLKKAKICLLYTSPSPRDLSTSRMPSSA